MEQEFEIAGLARAATAPLAATVRRKGNSVELEINGKSYRAALHPLRDGEYRLELDGVSHRVWLAVRGDTVYIHAGGANRAVTRTDPLEKLTDASGAGGADRAEAPMPGTVLRLEVKPGDRVVRGQTLMVIESMKLETSIVAWRDGVVAEIHQLEGATFDRHAPLIALEPESSG